MSADAGQTPYDRRHLCFDRLDDGTLVATASNTGRSVAAIVHARTAGDNVYDQRRWSLAGDLLGEARPDGTAKTAATAMAEAAAALSVELSIDIDSVSVQGPERDERTCDDEAPDRAAERDLAATDGWGDR